MSGRNSYVFRLCFLLSSRDRSVPCSHGRRKSLHFFKSLFSHGRVIVYKLSKPLVFPSLTVVSLWPIGAPCRVRTGKGRKYRPD